MGNDKILKVLHITFNMGFGGTEQVIRQLITGMSNQSVESEILCIDGNIGAIGEELQNEGVLIHILQRRSGLDRKLISDIRQIVRHGCFDIVHCHQYTPYLYGFLATFGLSAKLVFTEHGRFHPDRYRYKALLINPLMSILTPAIVAISRSTRSSLARYEFMPSFKIQVIYNGINGLQFSQDAAKEVRKRLHIPPNAFIVGTVSRLDPVKNQPMMLRAFKRLLENNADVWLLLVGDGPDRGMLEQLATKLGISDRTVFTGFIKDPTDYLAAMNVFLLSSHTEGTSMTLLEAMSLGIPSVATRVGGNSEVVIEGKTGFLVSSEDDESFAKAIQRIKEEPALLQKLATQSRDHFKKFFTVKTMTDQYLNLYRQFTVN